MLLAVAMRSVTQSFCLHVQKKSYLILDSVFFCSVFRIYKLVKENAYSEIRTAKCFYNNIFCFFKIL